MKALLAGAITSFLLLFAASAAIAAPPDVELDRLGRDLTPVGAEKAGNGDGSIPAWDGGLTRPPAGWSAAMGYIDPFAGEKPLYEITAANADRYRERLSPGLMAVLKKYPEFRMRVYPTHRTAAYPKEVTDLARAQAGKVELDGVTLRNLGKSTIPFPLPKTGLEAIWNHLVRYHGGGLERAVDFFPVRSNGDYAKVGWRESLIYDQNFDEHEDNRLFSYLGYFTGPAELLGTYYLVHEYIDQVKEPRKAWIYNAGQRRVRRAPDLAYDNASNGSDGLAVVDQWNGYNGAPDRYDWKLLGKKEMFVSYNGYRIADKKINYDKIIKKNTVNSELMRYELHRVWVVEATLKPGQNHVYARRTFYLDEDSWSVLLDDAYDSRGQLWRTGIHGLVQFYDALVPLYRFELWHDLSNGAYILAGLDNAYKEPWKFGAKGRMIDFQTEALRRLGTR